MTRIFIAMHYLRIGGGERSLISLLNVLPKEEFQIDLFLYRHEGELLSEVPSHVRLLPEIPEYACIEATLKSVLLSKNWRIGLARLRAKWEAHKRIKKGSKDDISILQLVADHTTPLLPDLSSLGEYDLAISYMTPHNIVLDKVRAKQKWGWIHTDYDTITLDTAIELPVWSRLDHIVSISDQVTESFLKRFPSLSDKIIRIDNFIDTDLIHKAAMATDSLDPRFKPEEEGIITLLTMARFSYPKNIDGAVRICARLIHEHGLPVKWYILGDGGDRASVEAQIKSSGMEESFILLGNKSNPYPYIAKCAVYLQPSRYEGKSIAVQEAQVLGKPVIITRYATAQSQIEDGIDGFIVPLDEEGVADGIAGLLKDPERLTSVRKALADKQYNVAQIETFRRLVK